MKQKNQISAGRSLLPGVSYLTLIALVVVLASCSSSRRASKANTVPKKETAINSEPPEKSQEIEPSAPIEENMIGLQTKYADMVGVTPEEITNTPLYKLIDEWWAAPYNSPPGATPQEGIDCSGFAALVQKTIYNIYISGSAANISTIVEPITKEELREGDLVFFCCTTGSTDRDKISHVGTYLANGKFVHATTKKGVIITTLDDPYYWKDKLVKVGRLSGSDASANNTNSNTTIETTVITRTMQGTASYYADAFEGKKTSNGDTFSQSNLTAASKDLPFNTMVKVTNLKNNNSVIVKVNDRMGQRGRHLIDLTTSAFKELGTLADGVLQVKIEVLQ